MDPFSLLGGAAGAGDALKQLLATRFQQQLDTQKLDLARQAQQTDTGLKNRGMDIEEKRFAAEYAPKPTEWKPVTGANGESVMVNPFDPTKAVPIAGTGPKPIPTPRDLRLTRAGQMQLITPTGPQPLPAGFQQNPSDKVFEEPAPQQPKDTTQADANRMDRSYQFNIGQLEKIGQPVRDRADRLQRAMDSVDQATPQADALIAPEVLTAMAGGTGSGVRMNETELQRIVGGRSQWESLKAAVNKWRLDPTQALSITPEQRAEIKALLSQTRERANQKLSVLDKANEDLINAPDVTAHRRITAKAKADFEKADLAAATQPATTPKVQQWGRDAQGRPVPLP